MMFVNISNTQGVYPPTAVAQSPQTSAKQVSEEHRSSSSFSRKTTQLNHLYFRLSKYYRNITAESLLINKQ